MKTCSKCKEIKLESEFGNKTKGRLQSYCKPCNNEKNREYYANNREYHKKAIRARSTRYHNSLKVWIREIKSSNPCTDCGVTYPWYVMDFDHVLGKKINDVSLMVTNRVSKQKIQEEIDKCEVVCSNCHRIRTFTRSGLANN